MIVRALFALMLLSGSLVAAQEHAGHGAQPSAGERAHLKMMEELTGPLGVPMQQEGSGTSWQPASAPMSGHVLREDDWTLMLHYLVFGGLDLQGSRRGAAEGFSTSWVMGMAQRPLLGGQFAARAMLSLEPVLIGSDGYPLLLQTGESANGEPLIDRQHPHDLFMEAALRYRRAFSRGLGFELYLAPAGEPALGPTAFPHRLSAAADPMAPISHHWLDSTHITFGVVTAGVFTRFAKLEGSWFNGREPDEHRYDFDLRVPDSYSVRLSVNPTHEWSGQLSWGYLVSPEVLAPGENLHRITASLTCDRRLGGEGNWATTAAFGQNRGEHGIPSNAWLIESTLLVDQNELFVRAEYVAKNAHEFALEALDPDAPIPVGEIALGYLRTFGPWHGLLPGLGARGAINFAPPELEARYGTRVPLSLVVYARVRPAEMMH